MAPPETAYSQINTYYRNIRKISQTNKEEERG
jgi:hypothetical protein